MIHVKTCKELLSPLLVDRVARRFKLLSEPVRLQLLSVLHSEGELTVQELLKQQGITRQMSANI